MTGKALFFGRNIATEGDLLHSIMEYLYIIKFTYWRQNNGVMKIGNRIVKFFQDKDGNTIKGMPDIAGWCPDGRALFIEVKIPGKKPTREQANFLKNASAAGCVAFVAYSIDDVIRNLRTANAI